MFLELGTAAFAFSGIARHARELLFALRFRNGTAFSQKQGTRCMSLRGPLMVVRRIEVGLDGVKVHVDSLRLI